jgi:acyl carrier protein
LTAEDVYRVVVETVASTFSLETSAIRAETTADDVDGWDSLAHTVLLIRVGNALGTTVPERIASSVQNVGELVDQLTDHLGLGR